MRVPHIPMACLPLLAITLAPTMGWAQDAPPPPPAPVVVTPAPVVAEPAPVVTEKTVSQASGPSMAMVASGIVIFGVSYVPAVIVGASSGLDADRMLFVPVAGPWMDLAQRPGCDGSGSSCNGETTNKVLLVTDGVFQAIGVITTIGGFLTPAHETTTVRSAEEAPTWHVSPASFGAGGYGLQALGSF